MVAFDRQALQGRLEKIGPLCRTLFALSCAERLFPLYKSFSENAEQASPNRLRSTLDHLWESVLRKETNHSDHSFLNEYESLIPGEDAKWTPLNPLAENAVAALAYACQAEEAKNAAWAALQGYEAVDYIVHTLQAIDFEGPKSEEAILNNEYVQAELQRQLRDIAELECVLHDGGGFDTVVETFRNRAKSEGVALVPVAAQL